MCGISHPLSCGVSRRGATLLELLFAAALASLLLTMFVQVLVPMARGSAKTTDQATIEALAEVSVDKLTHDLQSSAAAGITYIEQDSSQSVRAALAIHPILDLAPDGTQVWDTQFIVWWWDGTQGRLYRQQGGTAAPDHPVRLTPTALIGLTVPGPGVRCLATDVQSFHLAGAGAVVQPPVGISLMLKRSSTAPSGYVSVDMESQVTFQNTAGFSVQVAP